MNSLIKLRDILNNPDVLDYQKNWIELGENSRCYLIYDLHLAKRILANKEFIPNNLIGNLNGLVKEPNFTFKSLSYYFDKSPFIINGMSHVKSRKDIIGFYRIIEDEIIHWLPSYLEDLFSSLNPELLDDPIKLTDYFIEKIFAKIIAYNLKCDANDLPKLPGKILCMFPNLKDLYSYEDDLSVLLNFINYQLTLNNRDIDDNWKLLSISIMGIDALGPAIIFGLLNSHNDDLFHHDKIFNESTPITVLSRLVNENLNIDDLKLIKNDVTHISPFLINQKIQYSSIEQEATIAFGHGVHMCPGRKIASVILVGFFDKWLVSNKNKLFDSNKYTFFKDLSVKVKKRHELIDLNR